MSTRFVFIMNYSSKFQDNWLKMPVFNDWLAKHESPYKTYCKLCVKTIELSNMAKRALTSHAEGMLRGFNVNSDTVTPNLRNETLVSLRTVYDALKVLQIDVSKFVVTKELIRLCRYKSIVSVNGIKRNCLCI